MRPHRDDFNWMAARTGNRATELTSQFQVLQSTDQATCIAKIPEFVAQEAVDYLSVGATITVTKLLREVIRSQDEFPDGEKTHLFQYWGFLDSRS